MTGDHCDCCRTAAAHRAADRAAIRILTCPHCGFQHAAAAGSYVRSHCCAQAAADGFRYVRP